MKTFICILALVASVVVSQAQSFTSTLNGANAGTPSTGTGFGTLNLSGTTLSYDVSYSGLTGDPSAAHVHHATAGITLINPFNPPLTAASGRYLGSMTLSAGEVTDLLSQNSYLNIHTPLFGGGEIRGNIVAVPEPSTLALIGVGAFLLFRFRSRARTA